MIEIRAFVCGIDCDWLGEHLREIRWIYNKIKIPGHNKYDDWGPWWTDSYTYWEADHIIPVSQGGGCCGLENYRTLCIPCHKKMSAKLAKNRARKQ
jgi:5-methylcytosine-specific restriction endonuclease McrA